MTGPRAAGHPATGPRPARRAAAALAGAATGAGLLALVPHLPRGWRDPFARHNHAGAEVTMLEGPAWAAAALVSTAVAGGPAHDLLVISAPAVLGTVDDLAGDRGTKGLRGHLGALADGRVTTGALKIAGLAGTALAAALIENHREERPTAGGRRGRSADGRVVDLLGVTRDTVVVAGSANLVNLFDLRPGRALKVALAATLAADLGVRATGRTPAPATAVLIGSSTSVLPADLSGRAMLGDSGANPLGALTGTMLVRTLGPRGRLVAAVALVGLTLASERVSFTEIIARTPWLRRLDEWGRPAETGP